MTEEASLECRLKEIDETKNYLLDEIKHNDLMSEKYEKTCKYLNHVEHLLILVSTVTGCVSDSAFASLVCVLISITSSAVGMKICAITAGINKYKSIIKYIQIVLLGKDKLNTIEVLISKTLINTHDEFISTNSVLREHNKMKEEIKKLVKLLWNTLYK